MGPMGTAKKILNAATRDCVIIFTSMNVLITSSQEVLSLNSPDRYLILPNECMKHGLFVSVMKYVRGLKI
jgi:hypothetical protein